MARRVQHTTTRKPGLLTRLRARTRPQTTTTTTTVTQTTSRNKRANRRAAHHTAPTHHTGAAHHTGLTATTPRRRVSMSDKVTGAMMKLRGSLTRRPGLKAAGTRRMHGTDGRGTHRVY